MARRKRYIRKPSKYEDQAVIVKSKVTEIVEQNVEHENGKYKTVFKCESSKVPEGRLCIQWGRSCIEIGCEIEMKGRFVSNKGKEVFLVWSSMITKKPEAVEVGEYG